MNVSIIVCSEEENFQTQEKTMSIERSALQEFLIGQLKKKPWGQSGIKRIVSNTCKG